MDKLQMAHDFAMKLISVGATNKTEDIIRLGWEYADAMQKELEEREPKPKGLSAIVKGFNNAAQENLAEQDAQMYGIGLIRILKKGDQLEYTRLNPKDVELNYCDDEFQPTGYEP